MIRSCLFTVLCFIICSSYAQVRVGLQAGYNSAKWDYTVTPGNWQTTNDAISGFNAGVLGLFDLNKHIGFEGALLFNRTGTKLMFGYRWDKSSREIKLNSLNLPLIVLYNVSVKNMRFGLGGGFYGAYILSGTEQGTTERVVINGPPIIQVIDNKVEFESPTQPFDPTNPAPINIKHFDGGYVIATTIEFKRLLLLRASYNGGFSEVLPAGYMFSGNFKNKLISVSLAVLLSRGKE